jgi:serine/threonine protein kinase
MPVTTVQEFLQLLEKSTLLSPEELAEIWNWPEDQPKSFAARLVEENRLTPWQAQQLLAGKGSRSQFFLGKYKLLELIGLGGMGAVYKAMQPGIARTVALKKLHKQVLKQPKAVERFLREIRSAAAVDDPHVVRAYDANCDGDTYYLVMEYVSGKNLKMWIKEQKSLPIGWSCECIRQAACGLQHAHELGMLHRDIKPSNLLVTQGDGDGLPVIKILDLGLARFSSETPQDGELTRSGQVLGTPDYMAPEQARDSKSADIRADIFSLGCTLFELLTGKLPFGGASVMEKLMARATEDAPPVNSLRADISPDLGAVVAKMLARDPRLRYSTPAEVAQALAPYAIGTAGAASATVRLSSPPAAATPTLDSHTDSTFKALHAEIANMAAEEASSTSSEPASAQPPWLKVAAALAAAVLLLVVVSTLVAKRKGPSATPAGNQRTSGKHHDGETADAAAGDEDSSPAPAKEAARQAALWVFKHGGSVEVAVEPGGFVLTGGAGKNRLRQADRHDAATAADLPTEKFEITAVHIHGGISLSAGDMRRMAKMNHLESLSLSETRFAETDLGELSKLESLHRLDLRETPVSDAGMAALKKLAVLQALDLSRTHISGAALVDLQAIRTLTELILEGTHLGDKDLRAFSQMPQLIVLSLAGTDVQGPGLQSLRSLKNLLTLDLSGMPLRDRALRHISGLESLEVLRLTRAKVTDDDLRLLSGMSKLKEFVLASTQVTGDGLKHLTWMAELERFDLQETFVGDTGLKFLMELPALKSLRLRRTLVTDEGAKQLQSLKKLEFVDLAETKVTRAGINALQAALPNCKIEF